MKIKSFFLLGKKEEKGNIDYFIKKALITGVEKGIFKKTNKIDRGGATGSFALVKLQKPKNPSSTQEKKSDEEGHVTDSETFKIKPRAATLRKHNLSDSELPSATTSTPKSSAKMIKTPRMKVKLLGSLDSEVVVTPIKRKSMRSYALDTDLNLLSRKKTTKDRKEIKAAGTKTKKG